MAQDILEISEKLLSGEIRPDRGAPGITPRGTAQEIDERTFYLCAMGNVAAFRTDDGLVLVDTSSPAYTDFVHEEVRRWDDRPVHTVVYTHGHLDHTSGVGPFDDEAERNGSPRPRVIAHENLPPRFDRYKMTPGYNAVINQRQFGSRNPTRQTSWPTDYRYPDETYRDHISLEIGGEVFELHHGKGETDDHTYVWIPGRKMLCCGDFFIWACPNAGNPQKAQRYPLEWAQALREMAELGAEILLPGHVVPIVGAEAIRTAFVDAADLLDSLCEQTIEMMNEGATLNEIIHSVEPPADLIDKSYLLPVYDEPEFVVHNIWRLYGGWWDGNPARLKPAPDRKLAAEVATLAGGPEQLAARARELAEGGDLRVACHLAQMAVEAAPEDKNTHSARTEVFEKRAASETSLMARAIFSTAAHESEQAYGTS